MQGTDQEIMQRHIPNNGIDVADEGLRRRRRGRHAVPVYAKDLKTLVGHVYPGVGYVPLGESPWSVPCMVEPTPSDEPPGTIPCPSELVALPNVVGLSTPQAAATLSSLGFSVNVVNVPKDSGPMAVIVGMSPAPGPSVHARTIVTIESSVPQGARLSTNGSTTTVPNVIGLSLADAAHRLSEAGFTYTVILKPSSSTPPGQIVSQAPVAAAKSTGGLEIMLTESTGSAGSELRLIPTPAQEMRACSGWSTDKLCEVSVPCCRSVDGLGRGSSTEFAREPASHCHQIVHDCPCATHARPLADLLRPTLLSVDCGSHRCHNWLPHLPPTREHDNADIAQSYYRRAHRSQASCDDDLAQLHA